MKRDQLKSLLLGAILLAGITLPAKAQIGEQRHNFAIGINGGANYSTVSFQPTIKQNGLLGITGGVTARYISEKYFAMICGAQLELNFSQRGWDEKFDPEQGFSSEDSYVRTMNYLEIPFLAHLAFGKDKGVQFFVPSRCLFVDCLRSSHSHSYLCSWEFTQLPPRCNANDFVYLSHISYSQPSSQPECSAQPVQSG